MSYIRYIIGFSVVESNFVRFFMFEDVEFVVLMGLRFISLVFFYGYLC